MTTFYLEASAFVKRYLAEQGTEVLDALLDKRAPGDFIASSVFSTLEIRAAINRQAHSGRFRRYPLGNLLFTLGLDARSLALSFTLDDSVVESAFSLVYKHHLRAGDALHLSYALLLKEATSVSGESLIVLTSDKELLAACQAEGIGTLNPEDADAQERLQRLRPI